MGLVSIDPVSERVGRDLDVGGKPRRQAKAVRDVQVERGLAVVAGGGDLAAPARFAENLCQNRGFGQHDQPFWRCAARGGGDRGAALFPALGQRPVPELVRHARPAGGDPFGGPELGVGPSRVVQ